MPPTTLTSTTRLPLIRTLTRSVLAGGAGHGRGPHTRGTQRAAEDPMWPQSDPYITLYHPTSPYITLYLPIATVLPRTRCGPNLTPITPLLHPSSPYITLYHPISDIHRSPGVPRGSLVRPGLWGVRLLQVGEGEAQGEAGVCEDEAQEEGLDQPRPAPLRLPAITSFCPSNRPFLPLDRSLTNPLSSCP